ncbi:MAG TPA: hypothetical protein VMA98_01660 [Candidatus Acidoferrales bacterium]|nr:hypothetical protein [Candidatus Acidoferrales bacterium]
MFEWKTVPVEEVLELLEQRSNETGRFERGCDIDRLHSAVAQLLAEGLQVFPIPLCTDIDLRELSLLLSGKDESARSRRRGRSERIDTLLDLAREFYSDWEREGHNR